MNFKHDLISTFYPEARISGYSSVDGTIEFYSRINSILDDSKIVLDFGSGRAAWYDDDTCLHRKNTRLLKGKAHKVVGCDIDSAIYNNKSVDERVILAPYTKLPFNDNSFDIIICDYTFEHIDNPEFISSEFYRLLKNDGWICARTPNKYSLISVMTRIIKNSFHSKILKYAQPWRNEIDIFPTKFKLNSIREISKHFSDKEYYNYTYRYEAEPAYHFNNKIIFFLLYLLNKLSPSILKTNLFVFLQKK